MTQCGMSKPHPGTRVTGSIYRKPTSGIKDASSKRMLNQEPFYSTLRERHAGRMCFWLHPQVLSLEWVPLAEGVG